VNVTDRNITAAVAERSPTRSATPTSVWIKHLIGLCALVGLLCAFNAQAIAVAVRVWWVSPTYSYCFFIIPVSAYFVWRRRHLLATLTPVAYPSALWLFPPLIVFSLAGKLAHINEAEQLAFVGMLQVVILASLGLQVYRQILFPALFLFFLVPMGEYLIVPLQHVTTHFISAGLTLLGIPHYTEINVIELSNGTYQVAEACAGLRFLIATIAIGVLFAYLTYRKWHKIILFIAATLVVPVIANGFRALGIVLLGYYSNNRIAHGFDHIIYGYGFLVAILMTLMIIGMRYADPIPNEVFSQEWSPPAQRPLIFGLTVLLSLSAISFVPAFLYWQNHRSLNLDKAAFSAPLNPPGWQTRTASGRWSPDFATPDARLSFAMRKAGLSPVDVFVNYYAGGIGSNSLITSTNKLWAEDVWHPLSQGSVEAALGGHKIRLGEAVVSSAGVTRIIWWTYWSNDRFTTKGLDIKLERLRRALSGGGGSALLAISTPVDVDKNRARARLRRALHALGPIATRLETAARS
jgi:exosortase A